MSAKSSNTIRVAIIGANGGIGRKVVELALQQGHFVRAVVRNPANLILTHPNLEIQRGDVMDLESLRPLFENVDVVTCVVGKNSAKETTLYSKGNENVLQAMEMTGVRRVFFISASGIEVNPTHSLIMRLATRFILQKILKHMYADLERMEKMVKNSTLDWTIVRPPRLTDEPITSKYRVSINRPLDNPWTISRSNVAHYIVHHLTTAETFRSTIEISDL
jgi:putative NADH-flavin reductase